MTTEAATGPVTPLGGGSAAQLERGALFGRYIVVERLGEGGMGVVFSAYDPSLDRRVALKVLRAEDEAGEAARLRSLRMQREAQAMAQVSHRNVVAIYEVGTVDDRLFLAMEHIQGETLTKWLAVRRPWQEVRDAFLECGRGLVAAHARGLVHRDFKPDNVLVGQDGRVAVTDFGVAALAGVRATDGPDPPSAPLAVALTHAGRVVGTPGYMAPEQVEGKKVDARADQFAFCVALYQALAGQRPFDDAGAGPRPVPAGAAMPSWMRPIVLRGLATEPAARFPTMTELLDALARGPAATGRRLAAAAGVAAIAVVAFVVWPRDAEVCTGFEARLAGVWDGAIKAEVGRAFAATGRAHAAESQRRVEAALDRYTGAWVAMRGDACRATAVRREQSAEMLDRRNACLDQRLASAGALARVLARADAAAIDRAVPAALTLEPIEDCADTAALGAVTPPPRDEVTRSRVDGLRARIARAMAMHRTGGVRSALAIAELLVVEARAIGHRPALADALAILTLMREDADDATAAPLLEESILTAASARDDRATARALLRLLTWLGARGRHPEALALRPAVEAAALRAGDPEALRVEIDEHIGMELRNAGRYVEAEAALRRALAAREQSGDAYSQVRTHNNMARVLSAQGKLVEAREHLEKAVALAEVALGPDHPTIAASVNELGTIAFMLREYDVSRAHWTRALGIIERVYGLESVRAASAVNNLAMLDARMGRPEQARAGYLKTLGIRERILGPDHSEVAGALNNVGGSFAEEGRRAEARPFFERALHIFEKSLGPEHAEVASSLQNLGILSMDDGQPAAALPYLRRTLAIREKHLTAEHPELAASQAELGECLVELGRNEEALALLEKAHAFQERISTGPGTRAYTKLALARALFALGRDRARAVKLAVEARALADDPEQVKTVDTWLARWRRARR